MYGKKTKQAHTSRSFEGQIRQVPGAQQMDAPICDPPSIPGREVNGYQLERHTSCRKAERTSAQRSAQVLSIEFSPWDESFRRDTYLYGRPWFSHFVEYTLVAGLGSCKIYPINRTNIPQFAIEQRVSGNQEIG
jgi:hypothetical protein